MFCNQESWEVFDMDKRERSSTWRDCYSQEQQLNPGDYFFCYLCFSIRLKRTEADQCLYVSADTRNVVHIRDERESSQKISRWSFQMRLYMYSYYSY